MSTLQSTNEIVAVGRIHGTGEMTGLVRRKDWSRTPLGPIDFWSETLRSTVKLLLLSPFSFALYWGSRVHPHLQRHLPALPRREASPGPW